jgi:glycosyltransferase involved in cell wall biosynthesis
MNAIEPANPVGKTIFLVSFMNVAGGQEAAVRVARGLRARGRDAEVWFLYREADVPGFRREPFVRVLLDRERPGVRGYLTIFWRLYTELRRARPEATVSFLPLANVGGQVVAMLAGVRRRIASARSPVSTYSRAMRLGDRLNARLGVYRGIVAVTREVGAGYGGLPARVRRRTRVVHNGIAWQPSALDRAAARAKLGLPAEGFLAASVGRFKEQKNYPFQVRIAAELQTARIVVAGDGPLRPEIEARIRAAGVEDRLLLLGNLSREAIADLYAAADAFLQPSLYEGQSNALLEAMHAGLPVLVSDVADQRETIIDDRGEAGGLLIGLDDPKPWAAALDRLAGNPAEAERWAAAARRRAADFTLERQLDGFAAAIDGATNAPPLPTPAVALGAAAPLRERVPALLATRFPEVLADLGRHGNAPHDRGVPLEGAVDAVYALVLAGRADRLTADVADRLAARLAATRLAGALSGEPPDALERANVHRTAYALGALALLKALGHDRFATVLRPDAFALDELVDPATGLPRYPARYAHHAWRVSHWIGGVPSILANLERHGEAAARLRVAGPCAPRAVLVAIAQSLVAPATGLLRTYRVPALQWGFRTLYRARHDPLLGELGGISHLLWVQHGLDAPIAGLEPLFAASRRALLAHPRFMEEAPYCLDFDILNNVRVTGERLGGLAGDSALAVRVRRLHADIRAFLAGEPPANYTLHKLPGALATLHEAALLVPDLASGLADDFNLARPLDVPRAAQWL